MCPENTYGQNCEDCGHCKSLPCDVSTGTCDGDCQPGYRGSRCMKGIADVHQSHILVAESMPKPNYYHHPHYLSIYKSEYVRQIVSWWTCLRWMQILLFFYLKIVKLNGWRYGLMGMQQYFLNQWQLIIMSLIISFIASLIVLNWF